MSKIHFVNDNSFSIENLNMLFKKSGVTELEYKPYSSDSDTELEDGAQTEIIINSIDDIIDYVKEYIKEGCKSERKVVLIGWDHEYKIKVFNKKTKKEIIIKDIDKWEDIKNKIEAFDFPHGDIDSIEVVVAEQFVSSNNIINYVKDYIKEGCENERKVVLNGWNQNIEIRIFNIKTKKEIIIKDIHTWEDIKTKIKKDDFPQEDIESIDVVVANPFISLRPPPKRLLDHSRSDHSLSPKKKQRMAKHEEEFKDLLNDMRRQKKDEINTVHDFVDMLNKIENKREKEKIVEVFDLVTKNTALKKTDSWVYTIYGDKTPTMITPKYNSTEYSKQIYEEKNAAVYNKLLTTYMYYDGRTTLPDTIGPIITFEILQKIKNLKGGEVTNITKLQLKIKPADHDPPKSNVNMWD